MKKFHWVLLVILFALAGLIWRGILVNLLTRPPNLSRHPLGPRFYCESCGWHFDDSPRVLPPLNCPKCKKPAAMRTAFGPSAAAPEFIQCNLCQAKIPYQLFKWPPAAKTRWEKRLNELKDGEFLSSDEMMDLQKTKLVKTSTLDWMRWDDYAKLPRNQAGAVRCPKCGNKDGAQFDFAVDPPGKPSGR